MIMNVAAARETNVQNCHLAAMLILDSLSVAAG